MLSFRALISFSSASSSSAPFSGFSSVVSSVLVSGSHAFASSPSSGFGSAGFSPSGVWVQLGERLVALLLGQALQKLAFGVAAHPCQPPRLGLDPGLGVRGLSDNGALQELHVVEMADAVLVVVEALGVVSDGEAVERRPTAELHELEGVVSVLRREADVPLDAEGVGRVDDVERADAPGRIVLPA